MKFKLRSGRLRFFFILMGLILNFKFVYAQPSTVDEIDQRLARYIEVLGYKAIEKQVTQNPQLYQAGEIFFNSKVMSGNRNISCRDCHNPAHGTSDGLPFSLGEGSVVGHRGLRDQAEGKIIRRHSPALYNLSSMKMMFWDARVAFGPFKREFQTPEPAFNGPNPSASEIVKHFRSALDAQTIFPLTNNDEMLGQKGSNELAALESNLAIWQQLVERIKRELPAAKDLIVQAFQLKSEDEMNIGHVAASLGEFIGMTFQVTDTPFDRYLRGDLSALDEKAKQGLEVFSTVGRCFACHAGEHLTANTLMSVGIPNLKSTDSAAIDYGHFEISGDENDKFRFKTPQLRNVALSAPYMHNGALISLESVVDHYNDIAVSLEEFVNLGQYDSHYNRSTSYVLDRDLNQRLHESIIQPFLRFGLGLSSEEKDQLVYFLHFGLLDHHQF